MKLINIWIGFPKTTNSCRIALFTTSISTSTLKTPTESSPQSTPSTNSIKIYSKAKNSSKPVSKNQSMSLILFMEPSELTSFKNQAKSSKPQKTYVPFSVLKEIRCKVKKLTKLCLISLPDIMISI